MKQIFVLCLLIFVLSCSNNEDNPLPYSELVKRAIIVTYRVDSMTNEGDRCGWYVLEPIDSISVDSTYMCSSLKIGDTLRISWTKELKEAGIARRRKR